MRNPLIRRIPREFKNDLGKYLALFLFMTLFIGIVSGFLVTDNGCMELYNRSFTENNIESGHFALNKELPDEIKENLEEKAEIKIYPYFYFEENITDTEKNIRVYSLERDVNRLFLMDGEYPCSDSEIALDRMFAHANKISVGDKIILSDKELTVSGLITSPDYSTLFEKSSDMMFDTQNFSVAVMTDSGIGSFSNSRTVYNYAWCWNETVKRENSTLAKEKSERLTDVFEEVLTDYNNSLYETGSTDFVTVEDYLPAYLNQAINFVGDDMGGDKIMFIVFDYIMTVVLAFVFAVTTSGTIAQEAGVIGTLRASGYTKGEILRHYLILPVLVTLVAAIIGNILGYTVFTSPIVDVYYGSYSLPPYVALWNAEAFLLTTVIPVIIMLVINVAVIWNKLRLSPLQFLRKELTDRKKKKALKLSPRIAFMTRFRLRIILQNIPNYITMFFGIFVGGVLVIFGLMFSPLLADYKEDIVNDRICDYQYVLTEMAETKDENAEKYAVMSLKTTDNRFMEDVISVYGITDNSVYAEAEITDGKVTISHGIAEKFGLKAGDTLTLKDRFNEKKQYSFEIGNTVNYNSGLAVFMPISDYCEKFGEQSGYFSGYFSNTELTDIDKAKIATIITVSDMTKASDQLTASIGEIMGMFCLVGVVVFCLLMFILSKQIIEKNANAISMTKILGFKNGEISSLYIIATSVVVVLSLLLTIPLVDMALKALFGGILYTRMTGYIPFFVSPVTYIEMVALGIASYALVAIIQIAKINRIPKSDALKNRE